MRHRAQRYLAAIATATILGTAIVVAPVAAAPVVLTSIYYGSNCAYGSGTPNTQYTFKLLEGSTLLTSKKTVADSGGYIGVCFNGGYELVAGYKLEIRAGAALTLVRTITVPNLGIKADRVTDVVSGVAPAGAPVKIQATAYLPGDYVNYNSLTQIVTTSGGGTYSYDFTAFGGIRGNDGVTMYYKPNGDYAGSTGDVWRVSLNVEYMRVARGQTKVSGVMNPGEAATITLMTSGNAVRGRAYVGADQYTGGYTGLFRTTTGATVYPVPANKVSASFASDALITLPSLTLTGAASTDVVSGVCMATQGVYIYAYSDTDSASGYTTSNGSGAFSMDLTSQMDLHAGDYISAKCKFDNGDEVLKEGVSG